MKLKTFFLALTFLTLASCSAPVDVAPSLTALPIATTQPTLAVPPTFPATSAVSTAENPALTQPPADMPTLAVPNAFCDDPRGRELINSFGKAIAAKDGPLLSSLVSPASGMDVRYYRDGNVVNYDVEHAKFVFETTYQADWGPSSGSGESTIRFVSGSHSAFFTTGVYAKCGCCMQSDQSWRRNLSTRLALSGYELLLCAFPWHRPIRWNGLGDLGRRYG